MTRDLVVLSAVVAILTVPLGVYRIWAWFDMRSAPPAARYYSGRLRRDPRPVVVLFQQRPPATAGALSPLAAVTGVAMALANLLGMIGGLYHASLGMAVAHGLMAYIALEATATAAAQMIRRRLP